MFWERSPGLQIHAPFHAQRTSMMDVFAFVLARESPKRTNISHGLLQTLLKESRRLAARA